jgi:hypothetical protein
LINLVKMIDVEKFFQEAFAKLQLEVVNAEEITEDVSFRVPVVTCTLHGMECQIQMNIEFCKKDFIKGKKVIMKKKV